MKTNTIRYWRFAYTSEEVIGEIPENLKLYCCNPESKPFSEKSKYPNCNYIGIIPYDKDLMNYYFPKPEHSETEDGGHRITYKHKEPWNCNIINIQDSQIIFLFEQIFILDIPAVNLTLDIPVLNTPLYYKVVCKKVAEYTDEFKNNIKLLSTMDSSTKEFKDKVTELFNPVIAYKKINSLSCIHYPTLNISSIYIKSLLDQTPMHQISREKTDMDILYKGGYREELQPCSKEEFEKVFNEEIKYIKEPL